MNRPLCVTVYTVLVRKSWIEKENSVAFNASSLRAPTADTADKVSKAIAAFADQYLPKAELPADAVRVGVYRDVGAGRSIGNLQRALGKFEALFGPFRVGEAKLEGALYRGRPADVTLKLATARSG